MTGDRLLAGIQWGMLLTAIALSLLTGWNALSNPASTRLAGVAQWLAVCGAVAMVVVTAAILHAETGLREWEVNPAPAVGVLGAMTGLLGVISVTITQRLLLLGGVIAGGAGLLGGTLVVLAGWRTA